MTENRHPPTPPPPPKNPAALMWSSLGLAVAILLAGFLFTFQFVEPPPPAAMTLSTGGERGGYYSFGKQFRTVLAEAGVDLKLLLSAGTVQNIDRLTDPANGVDAAFVQGGAVSPDMKEAPLLSLGSLFLEPMWVFTRTDAPLERLTQLQGLRLAVGPEGSGTRPVALKLLAKAGIDARTERFLPIGGTEAARALIEGRVDAAFFITAPQAAVVASLLGRPEIHLMSFARADALANAFPFLSKIPLPEGSLDLTRNIPDRDITLLGPTATLVVREDLHPALIGLLLETIMKVHGPGGWPPDPAGFPTTRFLEYPLDDEARRYFEEGPSLLQRFLPFWAASMVDRLKILLLPLITLLFPLFKILPPIYRWRVRAKIYRWYEDLRSIEEDGRRTDEPGAMANAMGRLEQLAEEAGRTSVPLSYADALYSLRLHIRMVRQELQRLSDQAD